MNNPIHVYAFAKKNLLKKIDPPNRLAEKKFWHKKPFDPPYKFSASDYKYINFTFSIIRV